MSAENCKIASFCASAAFLRVGRLLCQMLAIQKRKARCKYSVCCLMFATVKMLFCNKLASLFVSRLYAQRTDVSRISSFSCFLKQSRSSVELNERQCSFLSSDQVAFEDVARTAPGLIAVPLISRSELKRPSARGESASNEAADAPAP